MRRDYGVRPPGYRLPDDTRVGRVTLQVSDLARSVDYYQQVIGLHVTTRDARTALLGASGSRTLVELHERRGARPVPRHGRLGLYHFALLVPARADLARFVLHLADLGVRAASADHRVSEALYLWDPDGLGIEVYADRSPVQWQVHGRELVMTTEPLDLQDLVGGVDVPQWEGLAIGTVVGHVHLHVASLTRADALYHAALGFDKVVWSYPGALFLSAGGYHHHLATNTWAADAPAVGEDDARLLEWEILLPRGEDVEAAATSLTMSGYAATGVAGNRVVSDDWGTRLRLCAAGGA